ncbi:quinon protein alcohol dehydrogenase-like superfamily [Mycena galericulata]|nr:quinon protein alcohol dehydrogenase-like superfamily [Mycena galericulata]
MTSMTASAVFPPSSGKHSLSADFQQNGVPAVSEPWLTELTQFALNGETNVVVLSADASTLAAGVGDEIHVYDTATSQLLHTLRGDAGYIVEELEFHPGGRRIAAGTTQHSDRTLQFLVRVWDLDALSQSPDLDSADLQPQDAQILSGAPAAHNGPVLSGRLPSFAARVFSHDGRSLLYLPDRNNVAVLDAATLTERFRLSGHTNAIMWAETSPGDNVVATSSWDRTVRIWSMESGESLRVLEGAANQSWAGAFSPDGDLIAAGSGDQMVRIWGVDTGQLLFTLSGFGGWIRSLSFSPDGLQLAAGSSGGSLRVVDVKSWELAQSWQIDIEADRSAGLFLEIVGVQYTSRGDLFFCASDGYIFGYKPSQNLKWDFVRASLAKGVWFNTFAISKDGSKLVSALGSNVGIWKID